MVLRPGCPVVPLLVLSRRVAQPVLRLRNPVRWNISVIFNGIICIHYDKVSQCIYRLQYSYKFMEVRGRYATPPLLKEMT